MATRMAKEARPPRLRARGAPTKRSKRAQESAKTHRRSSQPLAHFVVLLSTALEIVEMFLQQPYNSKQRVE